MDIFVYYKKFLNVKTKPVIISENFEKKLESKLEQR